MALVTHQVQGSYAIFPLRAVSGTKGLVFERFATRFHWVAKTDRFPALKSKSCLSVGTSVVRKVNNKILRISAFKGSAKNNESGGKSSGPNFANDSAKLSHVQQESENMSTNTPEMKDVQLSYSSEVVRMSGSLAIQNLLKNWLTLLRTPPPPLPPQPNEAVDGTCGVSDPGRIPFVLELEPKEKRGNILTTFWGFLWALDTTVKVPILLFAPLYLAVNVAYGVEVSKELTPLWIFGPLIIAFYVKIFRGICALYALTFKQTVKVVKNSPASYSYIADGELRKEIHARVWQPLMDIKKKNYKEFSVRKMRELQVWMVEKYLDYVELIWPTYCRTIRFLKRANFI